MPVNYKTLRGEATAEFEINKSRFIAYVGRVSSDSDAADFIRQIKKKHWDARHNSSAYVIGERGQLQKADDDGEPSGTAGRPILEVIKKNDLKDIVIVVTRYFGGIKLGAGGLIRAYGKAAALGIANACLVEKKLFAKIRATIEYSFLGTVENNLRQSGYITESKDFSDCVTLTLLAGIAEKNQLIASLNDWTAANCLIEDLGEEYKEIELKEDSLEA
jgi:uncharacterized YigZ family protein